MQSDNKQARFKTKWDNVNTKNTSRKAPQNFGHG